MLGRTYYVVCDDCRRPGPASPTAIGARQLAKRGGWARVPKRPAVAGGSLGGDYCPNCKP